MSNILIMSHGRRKVLNIEEGGGTGPGGGGVITFLTLKTDNIAKLKIELKSILLEIPSNKIKVIYSKM